MAKNNSHVFPQQDEGTCGTYKINFLQEGLFKEIAFKIMSVSHTKYKKMTSTCYSQFCVQSIKFWCD